MVTKKAKTKEWYSIIAPKIFSEKEIGKTMAADPEQLIGRKITLNVVELAEDSDKFSMKVSLKIKKIDGKKALTELCGTEYMRDYISRMIMRRTRRVDIIENLKTKDGIGVRVKSIAITPRRIKNSIQEKIRSDIRSILKSDLENSTLDEFINNIIFDEIKHKILDEIRKIYPVRNFEIRKTEILT